MTERRRTPSRRTLARNWDELLQEIRVTQTGVQILTGFLLTVPFSQRFGDLSDFERKTYLAVLGGAVLTTALVVAPVAFHRMLFRRRRRELLVESANRFAIAGLGTLALTVSGVVLLVVDVVLGTRQGFVAGGIVFVALALTWAVGPFVADALADSPRNPPPDGPDGSDGSDADGEDPEEDEDEEGDEDEEERRRARDAE